jgi:hypothetical protein
MPLHAIHPIKIHLYPYPFRSTMVAGLTIEEIWAIICAYWVHEMDVITRSITEKLQQEGVSCDIASVVAISFVSWLVSINGPMPTVFLWSTDVEKNVRRLLSDTLLLRCNTEYRQLCESVLLEDIKKYVQFAQHYMQVRIDPIEMHIGGEVVDYTLYECSAVSSNTIFMVSSPTYIDKLPSCSGMNLSRKLKDKFKSMLLEKGGCFYKRECLTHTAHVNYIKKAFHILVHKFFDKSGISVTKNKKEKKTMVEIRDDLLSNIKYSKDKLENFDAIDFVLEEILSFLSHSYLVL